jgi:hypothetical protein
MTTKSMLRLCAAFEGTMGIALILNPDFVVREFFGGGASGDVTAARVTGVILLFLCLKCWPVGDDIEVRAVWALLTYDLLATFYLGYLKLVAGFLSALLWPIFLLHAVIALLLIGLASERFSAAMIDRANQH